MKTRNKYSLRTLHLCLAVAAALGGCATTGPNQNVFYGTGKIFRMNGLQLSELQSDTFNNGMARLTVKSNADAAAMDELISFYTGKASEALANGDAEQFAVAWHISKLLSKTRLEQAIGMGVFANSLIAGKTGKATLPGGARIFLSSSPYKTAAASNATRLSLQELVIDLESSVAANTDWAGLPKVAALGEIAGLLNGVMNGMEKRDSAATARNTAAIKSMTEGAAYAASDSFGNKYIVEKTNDGIILYNPDGAATNVDLNQLNFLPTVEAPEPYRYEAAKLYRNIMAFLHAKRNLSDVHGTYGSLIPNKLVFGDGKGFLNTDGTYSPTENVAAKNAYMTSKTYKLAVDLSDVDSLRRDPIYMSFQKKCSGFSWREYSGDALDHVSYSCLATDKSVTYSQTYVLNNDMKMQSWDSLLQDKKYQDILKQGYENGQLASAAASLLPVIGGVEAMADCAGLPSAVSTFVSKYTTSSVNSDVRKFISYSPEEESPSAVGKALTCAQGIAGVGTLAKGATKVADSLKIKNVLNSKGYKDATALMGLLDTELMYGKKSFDEISQSVGKFTSSDAAVLAKVFYDKVQQANTINQVAGAVVNSL